MHGYLKWVFYVAAFIASLGAIEVGLVALGTPIISQGGMLSGYETTLRYIIGLAGLASIILLLLMCWCDVSCSGAGCSKGKNCGPNCNCPNCKCSPNCQCPKCRAHIR